MAVANASKIGLILRRAKDGYMSMRGLQKDIEKEYSTLGGPDLMTWEKQKAYWEAEFIEDVQLRELREIWQQQASKFQKEMASNVTNWRRKTDTALTTVIYTAQDAPSIGKTTTSILQYLGRQMQQSAGAVLACNVSVTLPTANASNIGNPYISASLMRKDFLPGTGTVDNEAIFDLRMSLEYYSDTVLTGGLECSNAYHRDVTRHSPGKKAIQIVQDTEGGEQPSANGIGDNIIIDSKFQGKSTASRVMLKSTSGGLSGDGSNWALSSTQQYLDLMSLKVTQSAAASAWWYLGTYTGTPCLGNTNSYLLAAPSPMEADTIYYLSAMVYASGLTGGAIRMEIQDTTGGTRSLLSWTASGGGWARKEAYFRTPTAMSSNVRLSLVASGVNVSCYIDAIRLARPTEFGGIQWAPTTQSVAPSDYDRWDDGSTSNDEMGKIQYWLRDNYGQMLYSSSVATINFNDGSKGVGVTKLGEVTGVSLVDAGATNYTITLPGTSGEQARINSITVLCTADNTLSGDAKIKIGTAHAGEQILSEWDVEVDAENETNTVLNTGLNTNAVTGNDVLYIQVSSADSGTSGTITVVVEGVIT